MEEKTYTLDELKLEVDKFRNYLLKVCSKNECTINVKFEFNENISAFFVQTVETDIRINTI